MATDDPRSLGQRLAAAKAAAEALHADVARLVEEAVGDEALPRSWVYVSRALSRLEGAVKDLGVAVGDADAAERR